jgi:hypothetical protein
MYVLKDKKQRERGGGEIMRMKDSRDRMRGGRF